jgi:hypothetical protein
MTKSDLAQYASGSAYGAPEESDKIYSNDGLPAGIYSSALLIKGSGTAYDNKWFDIEKLNYNEIEETSIEFKPGQGYWLETVNGGYHWIYPKPY